MGANLKVDSAGTRQTTCVEASKALDNQNLVVCLQSRNGTAAVPQAAPVEHYAKLAANKTLTHAEYVKVCQKQNFYAVDQIWATAFITGNKLFSTSTGATTLVEAEDTTLLEEGVAASGTPA